MLKTAFKGMTLIIENVTWLKPASNLVRDQRSRKAGTCSIPHAEKRGCPSKDHMTYCLACFGCPVQITVLRYFYADGLLGFNLRMATKLFEKEKDLKMLCIVYILYFHLVCCVYSVFNIKGKIYT